jgi:predicted transposase YbfD/YdcC
MSQTPPVGSIPKHFSKITDPRIDRTKHHNLMDILIIAICAIICGADGWTEVELFGNQKIEWLRTFLNLPNGIPSHDTFGRVFAAIHPEEFQSSFLEWVQAIHELTDGQVIAIDGKQLRGSQDGGLGKAAIYMVSAWATENQLVLGQRKVDAKSNEITAIPQLLKLLDLQGCIVTIDAIGTQTKIAKQIRKQGGEYLLAVKENQGHLFEDLHDLFEDDWKYNFEDAPYSYAKTVNKGHGRIEIRQCWTISDRDYLANIRGLQDWEGVQSLVMIRSERRIGETVEFKTAISLRAWRATPKRSCEPNAVIGAWRMVCIGCWT